MLRSDDKKARQKCMKTDKIAEAKVKGGIFVGPHIKKLLGFEELEEQMSDLKRNAWQAFRMTMEGFLGNY